MQRRRGRRGRYRRTQWATFYTEGLPRLSVGGRVQGYIRPPSSKNLPIPPLLPSRSPARAFCSPSSLTYARAYDGPFTMDTIVAASWPSPLRRRSLVSSTDSICPPRGCLITGRRMDRGRERRLEAVRSYVSPCMCICVY